MPEKIIEDEFKKWSIEVDGLSMSREDIVKLAFLAGYQAAQQNLQRMAVKCGECGRECKPICTHCYRVE